MRYLQIVGGVAIVAILAWVIALAMRASKGDTVKKDKEGGAAQVGLIIMGIIVALLAMVGCAAMEAVPAGHVGVISLFGAVDEQRVLPEGVSFVNPLASVVEVDCRISAYTDAHTCASKDMQDVTVEISLNARLDAKGAANTYKNIGTAISQVGTRGGEPFYAPMWFTKIMRPAIQEVAKAEIARYSASDILSNRSAIKEAIQKSLIAWCEKYHLIITEVSLADIDFDPQYNAAIREKQVQEQKALQKTYELQRVTKEAEMAEAVAKGAADARIQQARGDAEAILVVAKAEAEANSLIARSLEGDGGARVLQQRQLEKWNGTLPTFMPGDTSGFLFTAPK